MLRTLLVSTIMLVLSVPQVGAAAAKGHSGRVVSVDTATGTLVIADMGPWRGSPEKSVTNITIVVDSETTVVQARRAEGPGPRGWSGEYVETPSSLSDIKPGDFISVQLRAGAPRRVAEKIIRVVTE